MQRSSYKDALKDEVESLFKNQQLRLHQLSNDLVQDWVGRVQGEIVRAQGMDEAILMNVRISNTDKFLQRTTEEYGLVLRHHLDSLQQVKGYTGRFDTPKQFENCCSQQALNPEVTYVSLLRKDDQNAIRSGLENADLDKLFKAVDSRFTLQGLHLDLKNTKIGDEGAQAISDFIKECPNLVSTAQDLSNLKLEDSSVISILENLENKNFLRDFSISQFGLNLSEKECSKNICTMLKNCAKSIEFLRMSFGNTNMKKLDMIDVCKAVNGMKELTGQELFLGGNTELDNRVFTEFLDCIKDKVHLRSLEIDVGWSSCDSEVVGMMLRNAPIFSRFRYIALYLNGIKLQKKDLEDLAEILTKNCAILEGVSIQIYGTGLVAKDIADFRSVLAMKVNRPNIEHD